MAISEKQARRGRDTLARSLTLILSAWDGETFECYTADEFDDLNRMHAAVRDLEQRLAVRISNLSFFGR